MSSLTYETGKNIENETVFDQLCTLSDIKWINDDKQHENNPKESEILFQRKGISSYQDKSMTSLTYESDIQMTKIDNVFTFLDFKNQIEEKDSYPVETKNLLFEYEIKEKKTNQINIEDVRFDDIENVTILPELETFLSEISENTENPGNQVQNFNIAADYMKETRNQELTDKEVLKDCKEATRIKNLLNSINNSRNQNESKITVDKTGVKTYLDNTKAANEFGKNPLYSNQIDSAGKHETLIQIHPSLDEVNNNQNQISDMELRDKLTDIKLSCDDHQFEIESSFVKNDRLSIIPIKKISNINYFYLCHYNKGMNNDLKITNYLKNQDELVGSPKKLQLKFKTSTHTTHLRRLTDFLLYNGFVNVRNLDVVDLIKKNQQEKKHARKFKKELRKNEESRNSSTLIRQQFAIIPNSDKYYNVQMNQSMSIVRPNFNKNNLDNIPVKIKTKEIIRTENTMLTLRFQHSQHTIRTAKRYDEVDNIIRIFNIERHKETQRSCEKHNELFHDIDSRKFKFSIFKLDMNKNTNFLQLPVRSFSRHSDRFLRYVRLPNYLPTIKCFPINRLKGKEGKPKFFVNLQNKMTIETSWIKFTCTVFADPNPEIYWFKDGIEMAFHSSKHIVNMKNGVISLQLYSVRPQDSGEYTCYARNIHGKASTTATLKIMTLYSQIPSGGVHANIIERIPKYELQCKTHGNYIMNTYKYVNLAPASVGMAGNKMVPAAFLCRPHFREIHITADKDLKISFRMTGIPTPEVILLKGLRNVMYDGRLYQEIYNNYVLLSLKRTRLCDGGSYCIIVQNCFGCERHFFKMKVAKPFVFESRNFVRCDISQTSNGIKKFDSIFD